jgi:Holliday junction resolvase RusA-like endonuclease
MKIRFTIHAEPVGKARPRVTKNGTFTPKATRQYEQLVKQEYKTQAAVQFGGWFADRQVSVKIRAYFKIPVSASLKRREDMTRGVIVPKKRPDIDNISKIILDSLNGAAWVDDAQVVALEVQKRYSHDPRVEVEITDGE